MRSILNQQSKIFKYVIICQYMCLCSYHLHSMYAFMLMYVSICQCLFSLCIMLLHAWNFASKSLVMICYHLSSFVIVYTSVAFPSLCLQLTYISMYWHVNMIACNTAHDKHKCQHILTYIDHESCTIEICRRKSLFAAYFNYFLS